MNDCYSPIFISSTVFRASGFSGLHPLAISRLAAVEDVSRAMGWLTDENFAPCGPVREDRLHHLHDPDYVRQLRQAEEVGSVSATQRATFHFGTMENPVFPGLFQRASTTVGGSILAAEMSLEHRICFHPGGGTHHGKRAQASGFCYFNDPAFAVLRYKELGLGKVAYVDLDAHHGDGVEAMFAENPTVSLCSVHEEKRWPYTGLGKSDDPSNALNLPVPIGLNDAEFGFLLDERVMPYLSAFGPEAIVVTCGADALIGDPLSGLEISNLALWDAVERLVALGVLTTLLGGGGYNPWTTVRAWSGLWARLVGSDPTVGLPPEVEVLFSSFDCDLVDEEDRDPRWLQRLDDVKNDGVVRDLVKDLASERRQP